MMRDSCYAKVTSPKINLASSELSSEIINGRKYIFLEFTYFMIDKLYA